MTSDRFIKGDYNQYHCELWINDEWFGDVRTEYADKFVDLLNGLLDENEQLKQRNDFLKKQLDRVCTDNEIMGDKLKKLERIL